MDIDQLIVFLKEEIAQSLDKKPDEIEQDVNFLRLGISSIQALKIINRVKKRLNVDINPVAIFEYKTIQELATHILEIC